MRCSLLSASAALFAVVSAIPQGSFGGAGQQASSAVASTTSTTATAAASVSLAAEATSTVACNNSPELCNRNYNNITHMGAHDAAFLRDSSTSYSTSGNQYYNATKALDSGLRLIQAQVHNSSGTLELCHTTCLLMDAGTLESWLSEIKTWMDANTNDVVTLLLVNSDDMSAATFGAVFESSGISTYGYTPSSTTGPITTWPTLQTLITANTRLITFVAAIDYDSTYPYLMDEWDYMFETAYGVSSLSGFNCTLDRPSTLDSSTSAVSSGYLGLLNHFADTAEALGITIPDVSDIETTNSNSSSTTGALYKQGSECESEWGLKPTFILVDFWNVGPSISTADILNGITPTGRTSVSTAQLSASDSSSSGVKRDAKGWASIVLGAMTVVAIGNFVWL